MKVVPVQQQPNGVDCGVFSIAFAYQIATTKSMLEEITFCIPKMRTHMLQCLKSNKISPFPLSKNTCKFSHPKEIDIQLFCSCRMPWKPSESKIKEKQMVECSKCGQWFHRMCERIPESVFLKRNCKSLWFCFSCSK